MQPIDPIIGRQVVEAWANYQAFAEADRARHLRAMTESDAATVLLALFRGPLPPPPPTTAQTSTGMVEMRRVLDAGAR